MVIIFIWISNCQPQSVVNAFQYVYRAPTNMFGVSDDAKFQLNSELATIESNYFLSNRRLQR